MAYGTSYPPWKQIESEYKSARFNLEQLLKEGGTIQSQTEQLILNLDQHFTKLEHRMSASVHLDLSLASPLPPPINRNKVKGMLAYRAWSMQVKGALSPSIAWSDNAWAREVAFADEPPTEYNTHGLHANRLEYWTANRYADFVSGIIDAYGTVVEHGDGVVRAECARILCIMLVLTEQTQALLILTGAFESLQYRYPNTPIYIFSPYQRDLFLWREVLINHGAV